MSGGLRLAVATCRSHGFIDHAAEGALLQTLASAGVLATLAPWDLIDPAEYDRVLIRTTWDYWERFDEFSTWAQLAGDRLINPANTVLANLKKRYLRTLGERGVPTVETLWVEQGGEQAAIAEARDRGWTGAVAKPEVGAGAYGLLAVGSLGDDRLLAHLKEQARAGLVLLQPFIQRVVDHGETSLVMIDGKLSHAVRKRAKPGDFRVQVDYGGKYEVVEATDAEHDVARRCLDAWRDAYGDSPLYARVDLVEPERGEPALIELELVEPELFFGMVKGSAERLARSLVASAG